MKIIQKIKEHKFNDKVAILASAIVAVIVFLGIYGPYSLDVTEDAWIFMQSFGSDTVQNYAGWTQYRISSWQYPLGLADMIAYGDGTYITFTDSIPYASIFFKLFDAVLPETFQFFGWFTLLCFVLQGIGACLLIKRRCRSYHQILLGEIFFLTSPELMMRAFQHTALGAHWFSLFALYFYLEYRSRKDAKLPWQLVLLAGLSVGIHPYFLPIVMIFVLLTAIEAFIKRYPVWKIAGFAGISVVVPYTMGVVIGALGTGIKNTRGGYGYAALDLHTLFDPKRYGGYTWTHILPVPEYTLEMKEGFFYLGLGVLLMAFTGAITFVIQVIRDREYIKKAWHVVRKNLVLICGMLFMTLFAVSNNVTWNDKMIIMIPLPEKILEYANIFRASARMFYPVYYLIMLVLVYYVAQIPWKKIVGVLMLVFVILHVVDMRDIFAMNHSRMKDNYGVETIMDDKTLANVSDKEVLVFIGTENFELQRILTIWAAKKDMGICYNIANTGKYPNCEMFTWAFMDNMNNGLIQDEIVYVTMDESVMQTWRDALNAAGKEYVEYNRGFYYFVYTE